MGMFEELREQGSLSGRAGDLDCLDPLPEGFAGRGKFLVAVKEKSVIKGKDVGHVSGDGATRFSGAIVGAKGPGGMGGVAGKLIGGEDPRSVQGLLQIFFLSGGLEQFQQGIACDATLVRLDLIGMIALGAAVRRLGKFSSNAGGTRKARILAVIRRKRFLKEIVAHGAGGA